MRRHADPESFRTAASRFLTGVTVVASICRDGRPAAMTANSFTTVSTRPPSVLVSLMRGRTWQAVAETGRYAVSVLRTADAAACAHFAGRPLAGDAPSLALLDGFAVLPGAIAGFACEVVRTIDVADHTLFIGEVRWCRHQEGPPLAFFAGRFRDGAGAEIAAPGPLARSVGEWAI